MGKGAVNPQQKLICWETKVMGCETFHSQNGIGDTFDPAPPGSRPAATHTYKGTRRILGQQEDLYSPRNSHF